jgi:hypothetical protein
MYAWVLRCSPVSPQATPSVLRRSAHVMPAQTIGARLICFVEWTVPSPGN